MKEKVEDSISAMHAPKSMGTTTGRSQSNTLAREQVVLC